MHGQRSWLSPFIQRIILVAQQVRMEKNWIDSLFAHLKLIQFDCVYFLIGTAFNSADSTDSEYC